MKKKLSIILSLIALVGVIVLAVVMACLNVSLADVSLDTFIGVMVTMIGILVTFAVGWQIINALEIKSKLAEIEKIKADVQSQQIQIQKATARSEYDCALNRSYTYYKLEEFVKAFATMLEAIHYYLLLDEYTDLDVLLKNLKAFAMGAYNQHCHEADHQLIVEMDTLIHESPKYPLIREKYEEAVKEYNKWLRVIVKDKKQDEETSKHNR